MTNADAVLRSRGGVLLVACVLVAVVAAPAVAQSATQQPVLDGIAAQYRDAARLWRPRLLPVAQQLFMVLAGIEFAVSGALWALRRDSLADIAAKFLLKFTLVAFLLALITSFTSWIPPIVNGFAAAGERAIGSSVTVSPSGIIDIGRQTALTVLNTLDVGVMLRNPAMALFGALAALLIAIARSEEHTSELQSRLHLVCRLLLEKKKHTITHLASDKESQ